MLLFYLYLKIALCVCSAQHKWSHPANWGRCRHSRDKITFDPSPPQNANAPALISRKTSQPSSRTNYGFASFNQSYDRGARFRPPLDPTIDLEKEWINYRKRRRDREREREIYQSHGNVSSGYGIRTTARIHKFYFKYWSWCEVLV